MEQPTEVLILDARAISRRRLVGDVWRARERLVQLAVTDFRVRYKRAFFGLLWAVALPLVQALVLAAIFSQFVRAETGGSYAVFVLAGVMPWSFFNSTLSVGATAIVGNADLTEKVWFPRAILPVVPTISNIVGFAISIVLLVLAALLLQHFLGPKLVLLIPASLLLIGLTTSMSLVLAALHTYFRDVRYFVQAGLLIGFYATPVIYPPSLLKGYAELLDLNPLTGVIGLFRLAVGIPGAVSIRALAVSCAVTFALLFASLEIYRRHDRLFVDYL